MEQNTFSIQLEQDERVQAKSVLTSFGWIKQDLNTPYMELKMKSPLNSVAILYTSGKIVFQGNEDFTQIIGAVKAEHIAEKNFVSHIGVDEVGKGDYFGPLVVVACFVNEEFLTKIKNIGIGDSKKFSDDKIMDMYLHIKEYPYYYISVVDPKEYDDLNREFKNVSIILAKQHAKVIEEGLKDLKEKKVECKKVVIDQFSKRKDRVINELGVLGKSIELEQFHKGESDIAVAAASVIARGIFLEKWREMSQKYSFSFPKGASDVIEDARAFVDLHGLDELKNVAKVSFKTTKKVLQREM